MAETLQMLLALAVGLLLAVRLAIRYRAEARARAEAPERLFAPLVPLLENARPVSVSVAGSAEIAGHYCGLPVRIRAVTDLLALRKLPSLWLMITIPAPLPVRARFDMMMRPAGQTSFSHFDDLPEIVPLPPGFPEDAVARSDNRSLAPPPGTFLPYLAPFFTPAGKELLVAPEGLRIVLQAAEGRRARYGVFRQADFGEDPVDPAPVAAALALLADLHIHLTAKGSLDADPRTAAGAA